VFLASTPLSTPKGLSLLVQEFFLFVISRLAVYMPFPKARYDAKPSDKVGKVVKSIQEKIPQRAFERSRWRGGHLWVMVAAVG